MLFAPANYCLPQQINPDLIACSNQQIPSLWSHLASSARPDEHHLRVVYRRKVYTTSSERKVVVLHRGDNLEPEILDRLILHTAEEMAWTTQKVVGDSDAVDDDELEDYGITRHITSLADIKSWKLVSLLASTIFT